ncbi:sensor histidine kinase LiaS [Robertmurraya siralis]|uniref:histidine kinase n=1 Tax=Robertmurraya siralis TaxID=77777 RepID=A0A920BU53_9BACI|nr:sensor histidine kinase [Robertmurraya siralis]PAE20742.1 sensor histidine kinase [Bacillus sp. 7504-2]GIN62870.1 sensor histidine kinase LiaS [Robertmurraya siralis]
MKKLNSIRYWFLQNYLMMAFISTLILFIGFQLLLVNRSITLTIENTFWFSMIAFIVFLFVGAYFGYRSSSLLKGRLTDLLLYVSSLRSGNLPGRIEVNDNDEIGMISEELNQLAEFIEEQKHSLQRLADTKTSLAQSAHAAVVMEERQRLARDLHDVVSQQLFALSMMSSATLRLFEIDREKAKEQLEEISKIAAHAQGEMRALLLHLRPIQLSDDRLCDGVIKLIQDLKGKTNIEFQASIDEIVHISKAAEEHLFRIIQEALSNVLRHAEASKISISLTEEERYIYLFISDNGKGFNPTIERVASYGLKTMRERCEEVGGVFNIRSKEREGTYIDIRIPTTRGE